MAEMHGHLKLDGVTGESAHDGFKGHMDILSCDFGAENNSTIATGSGGGSGKAKVHELTITKNPCTASPVLFSYVCTGKHVDSAVMTLTKTGGPANVDFVVVTMKGVNVTYHKLIHSGGDTQPKEEVRLAFGEVQFDYVPQDAKGAKKAAISQKFNVQTGKAS
ncbi:MAG: type VI secretion system tube protein Hcp [Myxococcota bacterium]|nr:type VI secretion system tube protein Hcp [Myxococcota bacterium]